MLSLNLKELNIHTDFNDRMQNALNQLQGQIVHCAKTPWSNFMPKLFTVQDHFYIVQCPFVHVQNRHANVQVPFVHDARPSCKRSMPFCTRRKTVLQTFNVLLHTMQNRHANVQCPFVHDANRLELTSITFCMTVWLWLKLLHRLFVYFLLCFTDNMFVFYFTSQILYRFPKILYRIV